MRIAQIVCTFPPYKGGIGNSVYNFSRRLSRMGADVTIFTPNYQGVSSEYNDYFKLRRLNPIFKFGNAAFLPQLVWKLKNFDIIHLHLPFIGGTAPVLMAALFFPKKKIIVTYHMDLIGRRIKKFLFWIYKKFIASLVLWRANRIVVSSFDYLRSSDIAYYFKRKSEKFVEVPFGVDIGRFHPEPKNKDLMEKYFIEKDNKVILFVGGLDPAHYFKGREILMRAFRNIDGDNIKLLIVGDGDMKADYQDKAEAFNIAKRVIFAGNVNDTELPLYYNLADVFVLPSIDRSEAFGMVLLEAAACGKPLIASNLPGVRTLVRDGVNGFLVEPKDDGDLGKKIKIILDDDALRKAMGIASRQAMENGYRWEKTAENLLGIYKTDF